MARGVNRVILIGNLGADPDCRYTAAGTAVANVSLATTDQWKDKQSGENQERTEWHRLVFFGRLAEIAQQYIKKGSKIYVDGRLQTRKWSGQDGTDRYTTEIVVNDMQMLDSKGGDGSSQARAGAQADAYAAASRGSAGAAGFGAASGADPDDPLDDDIPFNLGARETPKTTRTTRCNGDPDG